MSHRRNLRIASILHAIAAVLTMGMLGSTLLLLAACSTQNNIVNPSPGTWKIVHSANPGSAQNYLSAVAATSATDAWAVGSFSNKHLGSQGTMALIEHWNGSAWSVVKSLTPPLGNSYLSEVTAISSTDAWAVGDTFSNSNNNVSHTLIEHWNGTAWVVVASPILASGAQLTRIAAISATDIWAIGIGNNDVQSFIIHWDGKAWREVPIPNPGKGANALSGLAAISTNDVWAVGTFSNGNQGLLNGEELIEHWNGTSWTVIPDAHVGAQGNYLSAIAAVSPNDVWTVGNTSTSNTFNGYTVTDTLIEHWDGKIWSIVRGQSPGKESSTLSAIVALSAHDIWAVGSSSSSVDTQEAQTLIEHWNGTAWSTVASPGIGANNTGLVDGVLVPHSTRIWAVGTGATYGTPVNVTPSTAGGLTQETPVTAQTLIESCCS